MPLLPRHQKISLTKIELPLLLLGFIVGVSCSLGCTPRFARYTSKTTPLRQEIPARHLAIEVEELFFRPSSGIFIRDTTCWIGLSLVMRNDSPDTVSVDQGAFILLIGGKDVSSDIQLLPYALGLGKFPHEFKDEMTTSNRLKFELGPGAERDLWLLYKEDNPHKAYDRLALHFNPAPGETLLLTLRECPRPTWTNVDEEEPSWLSPTLRSSFRVIAFGANEYSIPGLVFWYQSAHYKIGTSLEPGALYQSSPNGYQRARTLSSEMSLSYRPEHWALGAFTAFHIAWVDFTQAALFMDRVSTDAVIGFEFFSQFTMIPQYSLRVGFLHTFDRVSFSESHGASLTMDFRTY
ncbi:MAG: hypothetical protein A2284_03305 [Deltaproteobacteria bacterium RIFOXYA12_FULL_61_11]|nr:MAG: hypothetical protein A2284_03305 [Deltaproteobacteria bacterium RIFOXYA12_FULL_61_11]